MLLLALSLFVLCVSSRAYKFMPNCCSSIAKKWAKKCFEFFFSFSPSQTFLYVMCFKEAITINFLSSHLVCIMKKLRAMQWEKFIYLFYNYVFLAKAFPSYCSCLYSCAEILAAENFISHRIKVACRNAEISRTWGCRSEWEMR